MEKPTSKRKEREREARREAILDAAGKVFSLKGYHEATLDEIAAEAELAKGTIYNYYNDKLDILVSLITNGHVQFQTLLQELVSRRGTLQEFIRDMFAFSLKHMVEHRYLFRVFFSAESQVPVNLREQMMQTFHGQVETIAEKLAEALATITETKHLSETDRITGARIILASMRFLFVHGVKDTDTLLPQQEIENFTRLLCRALSTEQTT
jgi:AcrR family transcriptional regulator